MDPQGGRPTNVRLHNRAQVLRILASEGECSRAELARQLGLTKAAMTHIIAELIDENILIETTPESGGSPGRPGSALKISPDAPRLMGVLVRRDGVEAALGTPDGRIIRRAARPFSRPVPPLAE